MGDFQPVVSLTCENEFKMYTPLFDYILSVKDENESLFPHSMMGIILFSSSTIPYICLNYNVTRGRSEPKKDLARSTVSSKTDIGKCFSFMVFLFWTLKQKFKTKYILQAICDEDQGQHGCSLFIVGPMRTGEGSK